jgi:hypothetical protein
MFKKIIYWVIIVFVIFFILSLFTKNGVDSFIQGIMTGFSFCIGQILVNEYGHKGVKKIIKKLKKKKFK